MFDPTVKDLVELEPLAADPPYLLHLEFVAGHDVVTLPRKLHAHNGLLETISNLAQLEALSARVPTVSSWQELLAPPAAGRPGKKRRSS